MKPQIEKRVMKGEAAHKITGLRGYYKLLEQRAEIKTKSTFKTQKTK